MMILKEQMYPSVFATLGTFQHKVYQIQHRDIIIITIIKVVKLLSEDFLNFINYMGQNIFPNKGLMVNKEHW